MSPSSCFSLEELHSASEQVADREVLWKHFISELKRWGIVRVTEDEVELLVTGESKPHRFVVKPHSLREALTRAQAMNLRNHPAPARMTRLPVWFLSDLDEIIGSNENPIEEPFVLLDENAEFQTSARAELPAIRSQPPSRSATGTMSGGHWEAKHGRNPDQAEA